MRNKLVTAFEEKIIKKLNKKYDFRSGDTVRVHYKIMEGPASEEEGDKGKEKKKERTRIQVFEGVVTRVRNGLTDATFTVRKIAANAVGVERIFPTYSPFVEKIEVMARGITGRSRLYYLRDRSGKSARIRSKYFGQALVAESMLTGEQTTAAELEPQRSPAMESVKDAAPVEQTSHKEEHAAEEKPAKTKAAKEKPVAGAKAKKPAKKPAKK